MSLLLIYFKYKCIHVSPKLPIYSFPSGKHKFPKSVSLSLFCSKFTSIIFSDSTYKRYHICLCPIYFT